MRTVKIRLHTSHLLAFCPDPVSASAIVAPIARLMDDLNPSLTAPLGRETDSVTAVSSTLQGIDKREEISMRSISQCEIKEDNVKNAISCGL